MASLHPVHGPLVPDLGEGGAAQEPRRQERGAVPAQEEDPRSAVEGRPQGSPRGTGGKVNCYR